MQHVSFNTPYRPDRAAVKITQHLQFCNTTIANHWDCLWVSITFTVVFQDSWTIIVRFTMDLFNEGILTNQERHLRMDSPFLGLSDMGLSWPWPPQSQLRSMSRKRPLYFLSLKLFWVSDCFKKEPRLGIHPKDTILWILQYTIFGRPATIAQFPLQILERAKYMCSPHRKLNLIPLRSTSVAILSRQASL